MYRVGGGGGGGGGGGPDSAPHPPKKTWAGMVDKVILVCGVRSGLRPRTHASNPFLSSYFVKAVAGEGQLKKKPDIKVIW